MSGKLSALTPGTSGVTPFRNPNDTGLLGLSNEILMEIALRVLLSDSPNVNALEGTCWRLRCICRDDHFRKQVPGAIFFSNLQRGNVACRQIDMSGFSGVLPAGEGRLVAYKQHHDQAYHECQGPLCTTCGAISCTVTVLDTKKNTQSSPFDVSAASSNLHVVGNDKLLVCSPNNLAIFDLTTGIPISKLPLEEGERRYVAASPCADGRIAYATRLKTWQDRLSDSMLAVWSPETGGRINMPLGLPRETFVHKIETYGNIVLGFTRQYGTGDNHVEIWDLDTQRLYSSREVAVLARGLPEPDDALCTRPWVMYGHKLVALNFSREEICVWDYPAGANAVAVSTLQIHEAPSLLPIRRRYAQSLTLSPCEKWVVICYLEWGQGQLEARSLEQLEKAVALRERKEIKMMKHLPSSPLHMSTPCIAVGRRVLFNMAEGACFGIWDPQKPYDPIETVSLGDKVSLLCKQGQVVDAVMLSKRGDGEQPTVCWPTQSVISLGGSSILFGCVPRCAPTFMPSALIVSTASQEEATLPLMVWDFNAPALACDAVVARGPYAELVRQPRRQWWELSPVLRRTITCLFFPPAAVAPCCIS